MVVVTAKGSLRALRRVHPALWLLAAGMTLLAAGSGYAVEVYAESATTCGSLLRPLAAEGFCEPYFAERETVVAVLLVLSACLAAAAGASAARRADERVGAQRALVDRGRFAVESFWWSVALPFAGLPVLFAGEIARGSASGVIMSGLPSGWAQLGLAASAVILSLMLRRCGLHRRAALAAAATAVPVAFAMQTALGYALEGAPLDETARLAVPPAWWLSSPVLWLCLLAAAELQRRGFLGPSEWWTAALLLMATAVATVVLIPQLLPAWRDAQGGRPYPVGGPDVETWLPVLAATAAGCILAVTVGYAVARRVHVDPAPVAASLAR